MKQLYIILFSVVLTISGCREKDNPISEISDSGNMAFVVDSFSFQAFKVNGSIRMPVNMVYHFKKMPGSLQTISISADSLGYILNMTPSEPTPAGATQIFSRDFYFPQYYSGLDSVYVHITFSGSFWERKDSTIITYGSFSRTDSVKFEAL